MSETCRTCPIAITDPDSPILCAAAARMALVEKTTDNEIVYIAGQLTAEQQIEQARKDSTYEAALDKLGFSPRKVRQARKCAQQILWDTCDFHNANSNS